MIDRDKLDRIFAALNILQTEAAELAVIYPPSAMVDGIVVAAVPLIEGGLGLIFEAASVAQSHDTVDGAREALAAKMQQKAQAKLDEKFPNG